MPQGMRPDLGILTGDGIGCQGAEGSAWSPEGFEEVLLVGVGWGRQAGLGGTESQVGWGGRGREGSGFPARQVDLERGEAEEWTSASSSRNCLTAASQLDYGLPLAREESGGTEEARGPRKACLF